LEKKQTSFLLLWNWRYFTIYTYISVLLVSLLTSQFQRRYFARNSHNVYDGVRIRWFLSQLACVYTCACVRILSIHFEATVKANDRPCPLELCGSMKHATRSADCNRISYNSKRPWAVLGCRLNLPTSFTKDIRLMTEQ
jgi:hypothetical protein